MDRALPYLYSQAEDGKLRYWRIHLRVDPSGRGYLWTEYGTQGGKKTITPPKEITYLSQPPPKEMFQKLLKLAQTKWENKKKLGFRESKQAAQKQPPAVIPMRTHNFTKSSHRIHYPAYVQVKYDGYRALTDLATNQMISRQGKPLQNVQYLLQETKKIPHQPGVYLDGELFLPEGIHQLKGLLSRSHNPKKQAIKYYIFDIFDLNQMEATFQQRWQRLQKIFAQQKFKHLHLAETYPVNSKKEVEAYLKKFLSQGHEGLVVRNKDGKYRLKARSMNVQKLIQVKRGMFQIVGYKEGARKQVVWEIKCQKSPKTFWAMPMGNQAYRQQLLKDAQKYIGKSVQIKYFEIDSNGCVTRNPVAVMTD